MLIDVILLGLYIVIPVCIFVHFSEQSLLQFLSKALIVNFLIVYIYIVAASFGYGVYLEYKLNSVAIGHDGLMPPYADMTDEQRLYSDLSSNDFGRNMSVVTGLFVSLAHTILFCVTSTVVKSIAYFRRQSR